MHSHAQFMHKLSMNRLNYANKSNQSKRNFSEGEATIYYE